jgi:two-component system nitrate/nitrite response regulator NarL
MTESIRVLVVDDHPLFRDGVVQSLSAAADMTVVGAASSGEEALAIACELLPDLVLLDMSLP